MSLVKALFVSLLLGFGVACGPLGPIPGGALRGPVHSGPVADWSFADATETIQLEARPSSPYSVNVWCGAVDGKLYVPTSLILGPDDPNERSWVRYVADDPNVRLRIDDTLYELRATRVEGDELEAARTHLLAKYEEDIDAHSTKAWIFRMDPR
jgi:hypothetical protein